MWRVGPRAISWFCKYIAYHIAVVLRVCTTVNAFEGGVRGPTQYCDRGTFNASCASDEIIIITQARYGRMELGPCITQNLGYLGCYADVTSLLAQRCSGKRQCSVPVNDDAFYQSNHRCPNDVKTHLEATYKCVKVLVSRSQECRQHGQQRAKVTDTSLMLVPSSDVQGHCPWQIGVSPGQTINVSMHTFPTSARSTDGFSDLNHACAEIATLIDGPITTPVTTCMSSPESRVQLYKSRGDTIVVKPPAKSAVQPYGAFLLEFTASGCARLDTPPGSTQTYLGDSTKIYCNSTGQSWYLTCKGTRWIGSPGNCTDDSSQAHGFNRANNGFPYGLLIAVAIGVALGVFCGGLLLTLVALKNNRRRAQRRRELEQTYYTTSKPHLCTEVQHLTDTSHRRHNFTPPDVTSTLHYCPAHQREAAVLIDCMTNDVYMKSPGTHSFDKTLECAPTNMPLTTFCTDTSNRINR